MPDCRQTVEQSTEIFMVYFLEEIMIIVITVIKNDTPLLISDGVAHILYYVHCLGSTSFITISHSFECWGKGITNLASCCCEFSLGLSLPVGINVLLLIQSLDAGWEDENNY